MRKVLRYPAFRVICWYLVFTLSGLFVLPATLQAAFISPSAKTLAEKDIDRLADVREALENDLLAEKLTSLGLLPEEIKARLDSLTPEERQAVLTDIDHVQAGGNGIVTLLIVILLVILILKLLDKEIVIK